MSPRPSGQAGPRDVTSAQARLERMRKKVQPERGCRTRLRGSSRAAGSRVLGYWEGWDLRATGSLACSQCGLSAARRQDTDPFISCIPLAAPWKLRRWGQGASLLPVCGLAVAPGLPCRLQGAGALPRLGQRCKLARRAQGAGSWWIWLGGGIEMIVVDICLSAAAILISGARPALICLLILM